MTPRYIMCTLKKGVTVHVIHHHLDMLPDAVETWCGKRGIPGPVRDAYLKCQVCLKTIRDTTGEKPQHEP